jgi:PAS domain S-box-containing protein
MDLHEKSLPGSYTESASHTVVSAQGHRAPWLHRNRLTANLALCFLAMTASTVLVGFFARNSDGTNVIWIANGLLLAYLLLAPRWHWPYYMAAGVAAMTAGGALIGEPWRNILMFNALNFIEVLLGAVLLRPRSLVLPRFTKWSYLLQFAAFAVITGPLVAGLIFTVISMALWRHDPTSTLMSWMTADCLGIAVSTPIFLAIFQSDIQFGLAWRRNWSYLILLMGVTVVVFARGPASYLFLIYPLLLWVLFRMGIGWAATGALFVAMVGGWFSAHGSGPLGAGSALSQVDRSLTLQIFVAVAIAMLYGVSVVMESQAASERRLKEIASLFSLVTNNSRDAILLTDFDDHRLYMSSAMKRLLQWSEEEFAQQRTMGLVHPEDRRKALRVMHNLISGGEGANIECRVLKRDGLYLWVEASLRVVRNPAKGVPRGVLNIVRDISERKVAEKRLQQAYSALEAAADKDPLTGLANRRRFDQFWPASGAAASANRSPCLC